MKEEIKLGDKGCVGLPYATGARCWLIVLTCMAVVCIQRPH